MRAISFILALAVVLATNPVAGSVDTLPGAGTFAFESTIAPTANMAVQVAGLSH